MVLKRWISNTSVEPNEEIGFTSDDFTSTRSRRGRSKKLPPTVLLPGIMKAKKQTPSLAKRRNVKLTLDLSPNPTTQEDDLPPTPQAPPRGNKKSSRYSTRAIALSTANVLYEDEVKANPEHVREINCRGKLFMDSSKSSEEAVRSQRLFFNLGQNLYLDKQPDKTWGWRRIT